ncbi:MAG: thiamine pyrophosphate-dependent dehydrogenase E1 component subunit alpha [Alphaproteobacteria bacterium]|nr:thiamine pyrophosphate-dependent dehydrogenase E1 component subunit alpha [Alphaproteobacteria bacterium]
MSDDLAIYAVKTMMMGRGFDEKSFSLQRQGRLGTFAPVIGQEASTLGPALALDPKRDWIAPQYRELPALLHMGLPFESIALYRLGRQAGACIPEGVHVLPHQISLAAQIPHAVGLGWGLKLQGKDGVSMAFFGDGASSEGDFHESCNLAGVMKAPVIFLLQDNGWAISTPRAIQTATTDFAARALGYGFPGFAVDGNDLFALYAATTEAVARARAGEGPTLIESRTFRMWAHTTADDPTRYVDPKVLEQWKKKDPIERVQKYLAAKGKWNDAMTAQFKEEVAAKVEKAYEYGFNYPPSKVEEIFENVFATITPQLERQRARHIALRS